MDHWNVAEILENLKFKHLMLTEDPKLGSLQQIIELSHAIVR